MTKRFRDRHTFELVDQPSNHEAAVRCYSCNSTTTRCRGQIVHFLGNPQSLSFNMGVACDEAVDVPGNMNVEYEIGLDTSAEVTCEKLDLRKMTHLPFVQCQNSHSSILLASMPDDNLMDTYDPCYDYDAEVTWFSREDQFPPRIDDDYDILIDSNGDDSSKKQLPVYMS